MKQNGRTDFKSVLPFFIFTGKSKAVRVFSIPSFASWWSLSRVTSTGGRQVIFRCRFGMIRPFRRLKNTKKPILNTTWCYICDTSVQEWGAGVLHFRFVRCRGQILLQKLQKNLFVGRADFSGHGSFRPVTTLSANRDAFRTSGQFCIIRKGSASAEEIFYPSGKRRKNILTNAGGVM